MEHVLHTLNEEFGWTGTLVINQDKVNNNLGMTLDYSKEGVVQVIMINYIKTMYEELLDNISSPATEDLFQIHAQPVSTP